MADTGAGDEQLKVTVEFGGGLDMFVKKERLQMVDGAKKAIVRMARQTGGKGTTIRRLIEHIGEDYLKASTDLFCTGSTLRPGILVIINDADWEITDDGMDKYDYKLQDEDEIVFVSTLHGG
ncbi:Ubiquitin- modifier 1 [Coemansia helicoidea]|uniref:Ubiquitin- modifier 1 n=1 Tax=Coemansia helicoidea TaxID=1286919 RepID=A0ACC1L190_9FUNG|nr:Ubiquitin- modifier 1 [Coemansia helicoidea]